MAQIVDWIWQRIGGTASRLLLGLMIATAPALAEQRVSLELVMAVDVSLSVNDIEYRLQIEGIAEAFRDPDIIRLIKDHDEGVAVLLTLWSGIRAANVPLAWTVLKDESGMLAYSNLIASLPRPEFGNFTALGQAISFAIEQIEGNSFAGDERTIDVSGDGKNNTGPAPEIVRLDAIGRHITVNGLAITNNEPALAAYYRATVIAGANSFVIAAVDYESFAEAFNRKLRRELNPKIALGNDNVDVAAAPR